MKIAVLLAAAIAVAAPPPAPEREYRQRVVKISDGDTFDVDAMVFGEPTRVRLLRIDTPEKGRFAHCPEEDAAGRAATAKLTDLIANGGGIVWIKARGKDQYNRPLVEAEISVRRKRVNLSDAMLASGLAAPYDGGRKSDWCLRLRGGPANDN